MATLHFKRSDFQVHALILCVYRKILTCCNVKKTTWFFMDWLLLQLLYSPSVWTLCFSACVFTVNLSKSLPVCSAPEQELSLQPQLCRDGRVKTSQYSTFPPNPNPNPKSLLFQKSEILNPTWDKYWWPYGSKLISCHFLNQDGCHFQVLALACYSQKQIHIRCQDKKQHWSFVRNASNYLYNDLIMPVKRWK